MATFQGVEIVASLPRLWSASEFARQNPSGVYLHATCVETSALDLKVAMDLAFLPDPAQVGNILQAMVDEWRADNPNVSAGGASTYADATEWLQEQGFTVEANVAGPNWWAEINAGLRAGCGYLVGTCNAQALPGDEAGVHCHGYSAQAVLADGRILCGDPDNAASQVLMPSNPVGHLVAYTEADMAAAGVLSLTKVHPMSLTSQGWKDDGTTLTAPNGIPVVHGFRDWVLSHAWDAGNWPLEPEHWGELEPRSNPGLGAGSMQTFRGVNGPVRLEWTAARGVFVGWAGQELLADEALLAKPVPAPIDVAGIKTELDLTANSANSILAGVAVMRGKLGG